MEVKTLQVYLRVLYTVNSNPQYILAKSSSHVPAIVCNETTTQSTASEPAYARTPLKACLVAVCDSSPELFQDPTRDYSLYALDPLESHPLPTSLGPTPQNTNSPRGVAVALGLMSRALESDDPTNVFVTGTIVPNASPVLEVVFAFRETRHMSKPTLHSYPSFGGIFGPGLSQSHNMSWSQVIETNGLSTSHLQRDQQEQLTLTRSADFPELYIGPPRRAPGRPEGSTSSKSKITSQASASSLSGTSSSRAVETLSRSKQKAGRKSKQMAKARPPPAPPTYSPFTCGPLMRHPVTGGPAAGTTGLPTFHQQSHSFSRNQTQQSHSQLYSQTQPYLQQAQNPLLALLSAISSTSSDNTATNATAEQQAALLSALQELLATNPHLLQLTATNTGSPTNNGEQTEEKQTHREGNGEDEDDDADSDIVILDSSTIDTTVFRKPSRNHNTSPLTTNPESPMPSRQDTDSSPFPASTPPSGHEITPASSQISTPRAMHEATTPTLKYVPSEGVNVTPERGLDIPTTPTPSRAWKRKLEEYVLDQSSLPPPRFPPSPTPSVAHTSSSRKALTAKRTASSPTHGAKSVSSPSVRLPSMLGSMRSMRSLGSRLQFNSLNSSTHQHPVFLGFNRSEGQSTAIVPGPSKSKIDHSGYAASSNVVSSSTSLKRRRTLNLTEFMEEREARKDAKVRKRVSSGRKEAGNASKVVPPRSVKLASSSRDVHSSPCPLFRSALVASSLPGSTCQPSVTPSAAVSNPPMATSACTAPSASASTVTPTKNPLKNFVLPAWARTSTAMLPRLSDEALARQRAEREVKKAQASLRRREAAKAKRKRLRGAEQPSKESSDEDDDTIANDPKPRTSNSSPSVAWSAPLLPSLPVFASDVVEPIPSSPSQSHRSLAAPIVPSTPPRRPVTLGSVVHRTPGKSDSGSLFTPSGQEQGSLFTPTTPNVIRPLNRAVFTPRSPTMFHYSSARKSPQKNTSQTPWTPKRNSSHHQTPRSLRSGRNAPFASPSLAMRSPQTPPRMGTRTFLLPLPSPCTLRTPHQQNQVRSKLLGGSAAVVSENSVIINEDSPLDKQNIEQDKGSKEENPCHEPDDVLIGGDSSIPRGQCSPSPPNINDGQGTSRPHNIAFNDNTSKAGEEYLSSPLPPSSPLPGSPFSSPTKQPNSDFDTPTTTNLVALDSDTLLPSVSDSDGHWGPASTTWLSDDACTASRFTESEASAWLTETDAWPTDTERGGPLLSDSDAVFGDMSSLLPFSASNWFSDDGDVDTDGESGVIDGRDDAFDTAAFERAFVALVERGGRGVSGMDEGGSSCATCAPGIKVTESEFWESMRPLLGGNALNGAGTTCGVVPGESVNEDKFAQDNQELLDSLVST